MRVDGMNSLTKIAEFLEPQIARTELRSESYVKNFFDRP
jgi:hypothetical protein